jgi:hypothetical protein
VQTNQWLVRAAPAQILESGRDDRPLPQPGSPAAQLIGRPPRISDSVPKTHFQASCMMSPRRTSWLLHPTCRPERLVHGQRVVHAPSCHPNRHHTRRHTASSRTLTLAQHHARPVKLAISLRAGTTLPRQKAQINQILFAPSSKQSINAWGQ